MFTRFLQKRAKNCRGEPPQMYHLPKGRRKKPGPVISPTMIHYPYRENRCMRRALRLRYVGASSSRVRFATPAGPSQRITRLYCAIYFPHDPLYCNKILAISCKGQTPTHRHTRCDHLPTNPRSSSHHTRWLPPVLLPPCITSRYCASHPPPSHILPTTRMQHLNINHQSSINRYNQSKVRTITTHSRDS